MQIPTTGLILIFTILVSTTLAIAAADKTPNADLVLTSCVHASFPQICIHTLSSYTGSTTTPRDLAQAAVRVSLGRARKVQTYLGTLKSQSKREQSALVDCLEQVGDSVDDLSKTLSELQHLRPGTFRWQMSNAQTWVSAALTNEDTCLDGFKEMETTVRVDVKRKMINVARVTSNALYLINRLDQTRHY
ncbi:pectinesterase inhibitor 3 [Impatiens glandulifera]|uniref:pectinesterase inhibitor 3 n=1 Tax=Impatiens glandulifera TaxID=253017 RepID=UPI001FB0A7BE|nr:pectinesterase inhibitor 3 [Impatiens glandulifera]